MQTKKTKTPDSAARQPRMNAVKSGAWSADVSSAKVYVRALVKALERMEDPFKVRDSAAGRCTATDGVDIAPTQPPSAPPT